MFVVGRFAFSYFLLFNSLLHNLMFFSTMPFGTSCSCYDIEKDNLAFSKVDAFHPDKVYYHGCLKTFLQITEWNGPEVLRLYAALVF